MDILGKMALRGSLERPVSQVGAGGVLVTCANPKYRQLGTVPFEALDPASRWRPVSA
jgi:hypothetical protein